MTLPEGHFRLYPSMRPHLTAGSYRFRTSQTMEAKEVGGATRDSGQLPVDDLRTYVEVTSPRYQLPPDQILSTFPPAGSQGAFGSRLPQIVIKRRTLPWERDVAPGTSAKTPWLALVVIAEGEATLELNKSVAECVTPGITLPGAADVSTGNYLAVRRSVINSVLPTRKDVPLLAHVREVDISDTELMMGDDDGVVAVVVANRLPLAARGTDGREAPVKYLAALISLEGQLDSLLPEAPPPDSWTSDLITVLQVAHAPAVMDQVIMHGGVNPAGPIDVVGGLTGLSLALDPGGQVQPRAVAHAQSYEQAILAPDATTTAYSGSGGWPTDHILDSATVSQVLATDFAHHDVGALIDPMFRYPVLAHWSFTSVGDTTFESLMTNLDSGLVGTPSRGPAPEGRQPLTVVETGHVELPHRTRHGDLTTSWYRGPLSPHPTDTTAPRLPLAHASDQLRIVVPDGREDLSLATAFEIGRLMALAHPSFVDALLRWRQHRFQLARGRSVLQATVDLGLDLDLLATLRDLPHELGLFITRPIVADPMEIIGPPLDLQPAGTDMRVLEELSLTATLPEALATGLAVDADLSLSPGVVLEVVKGQDVWQVSDLGTRVTNGLISEALHGVLDASVTKFAASTLGAEVVHDWIGGGVAWGGLDLDLIDTQLLDLGEVMVGRVGRGGRVIGPQDIRPRDALDDLTDTRTSDTDLTDTDLTDTGQPPTGPGDES
ncbi:hypothetical protein [Ornithinimicrobium cryptoxanthini]|uniref:hypothetical protein n=1 Tax=Ornithinimicrobium cryptoxanthini TaxID=2934161 RepID=UPI002119217E|nr:hypothetical protein [Ornithinimicrobium cryptoxanthini]